jgi:hypothetical protein
MSHKDYFSVSAASAGYDVADLIYMYVIPSIRRQSLRQISAGLSFVSGHARNFDQPD